MRPARLDYRRKSARPEEWLLIEWPEGMSEPERYWMSTLPATATLPMLVQTAKMRWRIERDYQELKQEFGLGHYEGRGWRGFHNHATLRIAAFGFLMAHRLQNSCIKKTLFNQKNLPYPKVTNREAAGRMQRHVPDSIATLRLLIARQIVIQLARCPCGCSINRKLRL